MAPALFALGALGALAMPAKTRACGPLSYEQELQTNADGSVFEGTTALNLLVVGSSDGVSAKLYRLVEEAEPVEVGVSAGSSALDAYMLRLTLAEAIEAGAEYRLVVEDTAEGQQASKEHTFSGVEAPARPEAIALSIGEPQLGRAGAGLCGEVFEPGKEAFLQLAETDALTAWQRGVRHQLLLDGAPAFKGEVPLIDSFGKPQAPAVRALADCSVQGVESSESLSNEGVLLKLEPKQYRVKWQLTFPDGTELTSSEQPLDLRCREDAAQDPTDDDDDDNDEGDGGENDPADRPASDSGICSVKPGHASNSGSLWGIALAACAFMLGRRRAR